MSKYAVKGLGRGRMWGDALGENYGATNSGSAPALEQAGPSR